MKTLQLTFLITIWLALPGCALFNPNSDSNSLENDPVARVALQFRDPAFSPGNGSVRAPNFEQRSPASVAAPTQLTVGMTMHRVRAIWGDPQDIETAGDPTLENQRWTFFTGLSGPYGLQSSRTVYFEKGRVAGWETGH